MVSYSSRELGTFCREGYIALPLTCRLNYPDIEKYVSLAPSVKWLYAPDLNTTFIKLVDLPQYGVNHRLQHCFLNNKDQYLCNLEIKKACSPDYEGVYKCEMTVEFKPGMGPPVGHYSVTGTVGKLGLSGSLCMYYFFIFIYLFACSSWILQ